MSPIFSFSFKILISKSFLGLLSFNASVFDLFVNLGEPDNSRSVCTMPVVFEIRLWF